MMIFANPPFIYTCSFLFQTDEAASLATKLFFFLMGIIAPIVISVLAVINDTTILVSNILRWFFYPFPVYAITSGYMNIA